MASPARRSVHIWCAIVAILFIMMGVAITVWALTFPSYKARRSVIERHWVPELIHKAKDGVERVNNVHRKVKEVMQSPQMVTMIEQMKKARPLKSPPPTSINSRIAFAPSGVPNVGQKHLDDEQQRQKTLPALQTMIKKRVGRDRSCEEVDHSSNNVNSFVGRTRLRPCPIAGDKDTDSKLESEIARDLNR